MRSKRPAIFAVPEGFPPEKPGADEVKRERTVSDTYLKNDATELESLDGELDGELDELTVPPGECPEESLERSVRESDILPLILPPSEIPEQPCRREAAVEQPTEKKVKRGRAFSSISSALVGVADRSGDRPSEMQKAVKDAAERAKPEKSRG